MIKRWLILSLLVLALIAADLPPAHIQGYIYPERCKQAGFLNQPTQNFNGQILDVYIDGAVVASTVIDVRVFQLEGKKRITKGSKNYFSLDIPADGFAIFILRDYPDYPWGGFTVKAGDRRTVNLCGAMPPISMKRKK